MKHHSILCVLAFCVGWSDLAARLYEHRSVFRIPIVSYSLCYQPTIPAAPAISKAHYVMFFCYVNRHILLAVSPFSVERGISICTKEITLLLRPCRSLRPSGTKIRFSHGAEAIAIQYCGAYLAFCNLRTARLYSVVCSPVLACLEEDMPTLISSSLCTLELNQDLIPDVSVHVFLSRMFALTTRITYWNHAYCTDSILYKVKILPALLFR
jgi:hypothetical protein